MSNVSGKKVLRSIAIPPTWPISRKEKYWIARPIPNGISYKFGMPLLLWLRDYLKISESKREAKYLVKHNKVFVNGQKINLYQPVGIFDVISIPDINKYYRVLINDKGKLYLKEIDEKESNIKIIRIIRKQTIKDNKIQVTGMDGRNFILDNNVNTGDSIVYDFKDRKIVNILKMEKGSLIYIFDGAKVGEIGKLEELRIFKKTFGHKRFITYRDSNNNVKSTIWDYAIVIGKENPLISL